MNSAASGFFDVVDANSGAKVRSGVFFSSGDGSFDPVDPDVFWYWPIGGNQLHRYTVSSGADVVFKTFGAALGSLGASVDWIDNSGRYFLLNIGGALRIWDRQADVLFSGSVSANFGGGWAGISPDARYVITAANPQHWSYPIDVNSQTLSSSGTMFWSLCGDHGDITTASDGKTYLVTANCYDEPATYRVDVSLPQSDPPGGLAQQKAQNQRLLLLTWNDAGHWSCVPRGPRRDWCFSSVESLDDHFSDMGAWRPYKEEIIALQIVSPFAVHRFFHHRSRGIGDGPTQLDSYARQARHSVSWDGGKVAFASDFGYQAPSGGYYNDVYVVNLP
jgi:hypothetical protein